MLIAHEADFESALRLDLAKPAFEASLFEVVVCQTECRRFLSNLAIWAAPTRVASPLALLPARSRIDKEPWGLVLILSAFNFPLQLSLLPLIAAIGAGNACVLKPSELSPRTAMLLASLLPRYVDVDAVQVIEGGVDVTTSLLRQKWDYIFFTGSEFVGKVVLRAAAEYLTPVTLELGGKSPTYIDKSADLNLAAKRIAWGKLLNAGQACIAPDYVLVHADVEKPFTLLVVQHMKAMLAGDAKKSASFGRIINTRHTERLASYLKDGKVVYGGQVDVANRFVAPTVLTDVKLDSRVMNEEIFGSILPIVPVSDVRHAIHIINTKSKPLALYVFANDSNIAETIIRETSSGGVTVNDVMMHFSNPNLPFGGVGASGMGAYHGKHGFDTFSHSKSILVKSTWLDAFVRYPPYNQFNLDVFRYIVEFERLNSASLQHGLLVTFAALLWRRLKGRVSPAKTTRTTLSPKARL